MAPQALAVVVGFCCAFAATTPYAAEQLLQLRDARIDLRTPNAAMAVGPRQIEAWAREAARAVSNYYDGFPIPRLDLRVRAVGGDDINGTAYGYDRHITIRLGRRADARELENDWVLVHEMLHMGHPDVSNRHKWFKEGLATYVEPVARARIGDQPVEEVWADFVRQIPQGQPRRGDRGLDYTPTWGRVYWGGAMFFLLADVGIRRATDNEKGLEHALRAIANAGGTLDAHWSMRRTLKIGDEAVGVPVLTELYERHRDKPVHVDLDALWRKLGVGQGVFGVRLRDDAPEADIRRAITGS